MPLGPKNLSSHTPNIFSGTLTSWGDILDSYANIVTIVAWAGVGKQDAAWREKLIHSGDMTSVRIARQGPIFEQK